MSAEKGRVGVGEGVLLRAEWAPGSCVCELGRVQVSVTPRTAARQAPPPTGFPRQEYCSGLPFPSPGDLPSSGPGPASCDSRPGPASPALAGGFLTTLPSGFFSGIQNTMCVFFRADTGSGAVCFSTEPWLRLFRVPQATQIGGWGAQEQAQGRRQPLAGTAHPSPLLSETPTPWSALLPHVEPCCSPRL